MAPTEAQQEQFFFKQLDKKNRGMKRVEGKRNWPAMWKEWETTLADIRCPESGGKKKGRMNVISL